MLRPLVEGDHDERQRDAESQPRCRSGQSRHRRPSTLTGLDHTVSGIGVAVTGLDDTVVRLLDGVVGIRHRLPIPPTFSSVSSVAHGMASSRSRGMGFIETTE